MAWQGGLTHWGQDKMAAISQITFSDTFSSIKMYWFWLKFYSQWFNQQYSIIGWDNSLAPSRRQAIIWNIADLIHWRIHVALGGDEMSGYLNQFWFLLDFDIIWERSLSLESMLSETEGPGASFKTHTLQLRFREFGAPIIYMITVPLLT